jgi:hypothetical protein
MPSDAPAARNFRYLTLLQNEVLKFSDGGQIGLWQADNLVAEVTQRQAAVRTHLEKQRILAAVPDEMPPRLSTAAGDRGVPPPDPAPPRGAAGASSSDRAAARRPFLEILLDPRSIQWLLALGGALLVLGLVIFLYARGWFENPKFVAAVMGLGTVAALAGGWWAILATRYHTAGRAVMLLACLVMPLNLWFYHAQELHPFTLYEHLWLAALLCCALYAASAYVLRDSTFVYVLMGGVTMTGLLILADVDGQEKFWQIAHPATLLVVLGLLAIHAERAFPAAEAAEHAPFTRRQFGLAFFWSGHAVLGLGLVLVLVAQLYGYLATPLDLQIEFLNLKQPSPITQDQPLKVLALCLVLAGMYAYAYSDLVVRRIGVYIYLAVFCVIWAEVLVLNLLPIDDESWKHALALLLLALTGMAANLATPWLKQAETSPAAGRQQSFLALRVPLDRAALPIGLFLSGLPVVLGLVLHARALLSEYKFTWLYVVAMMATAVSCRIGAQVHRETLTPLTTIYLFGTAAATMVAAAGLLHLFDLTSWQAQAPLLIWIPIAYLVAARLYRGRALARPVTWVAHAAAVVMLASSLAAAFQGFAVVRGDALNLSLAIFFAEAAVFYALAGVVHGKAQHVYLATAMACGAVWQLLTYGAVNDLYYILTFAIVGQLLLIAYRFAIPERFNVPWLADAAFRAGNVLLSLAFVAATLLTLTDLAAGKSEQQRALVSVLLILTAMSLVALALLRKPNWRQWYLVTTVTQAGLAILVLAVFGELSLPQKLEITAVVCGVAMLIVAHVGWYHENEQQSELTSFSLFFGSLLAAVPLTYATLYYRSSLKDFHWPDELGMLLVGILLLASGVVLRLKFTTLVGAGQLLLYLVTLPIFLKWDQLTWPAIFLMIGGGLIFALGIVLSIYRDRLLTLPDRIKRREGIFRVLAWR